MSLLRPLRAWIPYAVVIVAIILTLVGAYYVLRTNRAQDEAAFENAAAETRQLIEIRLDTYVELLRAGAALFAASDRTSVEEFRLFVRRLELRQRYPGIQGIGYAARVTKEEAADIGLWPPGVRDEYTSILYLEPPDRRNQAALGYDMLTEAVRRAAMERARDTGEPAASGRVTLVQEIDEDKQAGFLIYMPVYRKGAPTTSLEERRAALIGYVYSPFRARDLLSGILANRQGDPPLEYAVYDGSAPSPENLLHASRRQSPPTPHDPLEATHQLNVAGRQWTVTFRANQHFGGSPTWLAPVTLGIGLIVALALFGVTLAQVRGLEQAERHASELRAREEALRESEARLRRLVVLEREARAEAQAADRAKDEFLATLSHELRTPLNAILGWTTMLRSGKVRDERRTAALDVIERNARAQARLIEDLLDVSRIITGKVRLELHPLQPGPIVQTVVDALRPAADAKGVHLHGSIDPGVGAIMSDAARLQQIIWNLLANAIKFTPSGGDVYLELEEHDRALELRVRDTGVGIAPDFLPHVFERFRQADSSTTRAHGGVGLGLAIVRHLVELHGGSISAHSEGPDRGALFVARFPLAARAHADREPRDERGSAELEGVRVLVVDDDEDAREMLAAALAAGGARVVAAASADEALRLLQDQGADVMVSDIGMPAVDGYTLIRRIRQLPGEQGRIPAIALTAYARSEDRERALEAGYQLHLPKPIELDALQDAVGRLGPAPTQPR